MGLLGFAKDLILLPIDLTADATGLGAVKKIGMDNGEGGFLMTVDRLKSMAENINETYKK